MDTHAVDPKPGPRLSLPLVAGVLAAPVVLVIWTMIGFFLVMPLQAVVPDSGPGEAPPWLIYLGIFLLFFVWPLVLLRITRSVRALDITLMALYVVAAIAVLLGGDLVIFATAVETLAPRVTAAVLVVVAVALHAWLARRAIRRRNQDR